MKISFGRTWALAGAAAAAALSLSSQASARPVSIRDLAAQEVHLATIAYRIASANAQLCKASEFVTGLVLHDLTRYDRSIRPAVSRAFSVNRGFGIVGIVPGSVAADAGLQIDDEIIAINSLSVADAEAFERPKSYQRMERFNADIQAQLRYGQADLLVRRGGNLLRVPIRAQKGCGGNLTLTPSSTTNAWADGKHVIVTTGMTKLSRSDDEIAFVIAHEMAHNILGHTAKDGPKGIFGASKIKRGEIEADSFAVGLMVNGGYQPSGGISFLQNAARRMWWAVSLDHPGFGRRIKTVSAAMQLSRHSQNRLVAAPAPRKGRWS